jgi:ATPase subunit of ABC transporter with duplicated ATPase domains
VGHIEVAHVSHTLPDGRVLLDDVSFRVGDGMVAALVGPNGAGKTTLMRLAAGDMAPQSGSVTSSGGIGVMRQFVGGIRDQSTVRDLLLSIASPRVQQAAARLDAAELVMMERDDEPAQLRYAAALAEWGDAGGYQAEVHWDSCCTAALGVPYERCRFEEAGPPELAPREQNVRMRLRGGRTGKRVVICENLELTGLMHSFDVEVWYGERVAVLGSNGSGKSHFLRLLAGEPVRRRCCCSTSRPTTSTWPAPRPCRTAWNRTRAPCWLPATTAGSRGPSIGFWCSAPVVTCMRRRGRCGMRLAWTGRADRLAC